MEEQKKQEQESHSPTAEFVPYELVVKLKALGFDEPCLDYFANGNPQNSWSISYNSDDLHRSFESVARPTYQSAFRWFREKQGLIYSIGHIGHTNTWAYEIINMRIAGPNYGYGETYEEAELACLKKLISIVKEKL